MACYALMAWKISPQVQALTIKLQWSIVSKTPPHNHTNQRAFQYLLPNSSYDRQLEALQGDKKKESVGNSSNLQR